MSLFRRQEFASHSGALLSWKVECDALSAEDWASLAHIVGRWGLLFGSVECIPTGGYPFAAALEPYRTLGNSTVLLADDVLTTGASMEDARAEMSAPDVIGVVAFARVPPPPWIRAVWLLDSGDAARRVG